ncbi:autotransporter domain-containing protein [Pseudomonas sp. NY15436]|uniref:autotransporter domain-containing protein n=1 Tax=Pseudomonas sp. NY15436 TaxID=3400359 RepID=UPI003A8C82B2
MGLVSSTSNLTVNVQNGSQIYPGVVDMVNAVSLTGTGTTVNNAGRIDPSLQPGLVSLASGLNLSNAAGSTVTVNNLSTGQIMGTSGLLSANLLGLGGIGLVVQNGVGGTTTVNNTGLISGTALLGAAVLPEDMPVIALRGGARNELTNNASGLITGRVAMQASAAGNTFTNAGTVTGSINLGAGAGANTFNAITGSAMSAGAGVGVDLGVLGGLGLAYAPAGIVNAGTANNGNTLNLQNVIGGGSGLTGSGTIDGSKYINFSKLNVTSGTWSLTNQLFAGGTVNPAVALNGGLLNVDSAALTGATVTANGGGLGAAVAGATVSNGITLDTNGLLVSNSVNGLTLSGVLTGAGALTKTGTGNLTLAGTNDFSGGTTLTAGTLTLGNAAALGTEGLNVTGASTLANSSALSVNNGILLNGANLTVNSGAAMTLGGAINGTGSLTKTGNADLTLSGTNNFGGGLNINAGRLILANAGATGGGTLTAGVGGTAALDTSTAQTLTNLIQLNGNLTLTGSNDLTLVGKISGTGGLNKAGTNTVTLTGANDFTGNSTLGGGTLILQNSTSLGSSQLTLSANSTLDAGGLSLGNNINLGTRNLTLAGSNDLALNGDVSGTNGSLTKNGAANLVLNGINTYTGGTQVTSGTLLVGDSSHASARVAGPVSVSSGASLGGFGTVAGNVDVASGGHLASGAPVGVFTIAGDLTLRQGSLADFSLGTSNGFSTPGASHGVSVTGDLNLQGAQLNLLDAGGYGPGLYRLFDWGGALTMSNGGLIPQAGSSLQVLTFNKQINLINAINQPLNFWNANGLASASQMGGGSGVWSQSGANWTDATGSVTAWRNPNDAFSIFGGAAGTVTLDSSAGAIKAQGIQFASDGYHLVGDDLAVTGTVPSALGEVRVGDGSQAASAWTAYVDNSLTGAGIDKTGLGTLVLRGSNTYTQSTRLSLGTLSVSSDANLGASSANLDFEGGTLRVTGNSFQSTARNVVFGSDGGAIDIADASNTFSLGQALSGSGALTKLGDGTLVLTGNNSYSGSTLISAGTLTGSAGSFGSGAIVDNAALVLHQTTDATLSNAISGNGSLTKTGAGNLTLGSNSYSGGTLISAGTLTGSAGSFGSGAITNNARLILDQDSTSSFANVISGGGSLVKRGAGALELESDSSVGGGTRVEGGRLVVGGSAGSSARLTSNVDVVSGATLGGHGVIDGNVTLVSGAKLAPGNSIGTLTVDGDVTLGAGSILEVESAPDGNSDRLISTGAVNLNGANLNVLAGTEDWAPSTAYGIVQAASLNGTFAAVSSNLAFLTPQLAYSTTGVELTLERNDVSFISAGRTYNQRSAASGVESLATGSLYNAISVLSVEQAQAAYDSLSGELHSSTQGALFDDSRYVREAIGQRLRAAQGQASTDAILHTDADSGMTFWLQGYGGWGDTSGNSNTARMDHDSRGTLLGIDLPVGDNWRVGVAAGYGTSKLDVDARSSSAEIDSTSLTLFASGQWDALNLRLGASHAWNDIDSSRHVQVGSLAEHDKAGYDANTTQVFGELGYAIAAGDFILEPFAGLAHVKVDSDSFKEHGGSTALRGNREQDEVTYGTLGLHASTALTTVGSVPLALLGTLGWQHAFDDLDPKRQLSFAGGDAFTVKGTPLAQDTALAQLGVTAQVASGTTVDLGYSGQFGDGYKDNGIRLGLNVSF